MPLSEACHAVRAVALQTHDIRGKTTNDAVVLETTYRHYPLAWRPEPYQAGSGWPPTSGRYAIRVESLPLRPCPLSGGEGTERKLCLCDRDSEFPILSHRFCYS